MFVSASSSASSAGIFRIGNKEAAQTLVKKHDIDKDGKLDKDEAGAVKILSNRNFKLADSVGDGKLTEKELETYISTMKLEFLRGNSSPLGGLLGGAPVSEANFARIDAEAKRQSGKLNFLNSMVDLEKTYQKYQAEGKFDIKV